MSSNYHLNSQVLTRFDQSPTVISTIPRKFLLPDYKSNFNFKSTDFIKSLDYTKESQVKPLKSSNSSSNQRRKFSPEEDILLNKIIAIHGPRKWDQIALSLPGRTGRQCRDRFQNYLKPSLTNGPWTREEDKLLEQKVYEVGQHWNKIAKFFKGRSSNNIKNRYYTYINKQRQINYQPISGKKIDKNTKKYEFQLNEYNYCNECQYNDIDENNNYDYLNKVSAINYTEDTYNSNFLLQNDNNHEKSSINDLDAIDANNIIFDFDDSKSKNKKKMFFPLICPPNNDFILPSNKGLFNFLAQ